VNPALAVHVIGRVHLTELLATLADQDFQDFEVVVSDQSDTRNVGEVCARYSDQIAIVRVDNRAGLRQAAANTNVAMRHATGHILKIMFQDDFFCHNGALRILSEMFQRPDVQWALCGSCITRDGEIFESPMVPQMNPNVHLGKNTVSSPSVLALRSGTRLEFDEELIWLMDGDFYKRCADQLGAPAICPDILVANRLHPEQVSASVSPQLRRRELTYMRSKHRTSERLGNRLHFIKQWLKAR
ncbi:MAG: glycosyltransferase, partial [Pseudomonadota bacterium]